MTRREAGSFQNQEAATNAGLQDDSEWPIKRRTLLIRTTALSVVLFASGVAAGVYLPVSKRPESWDGAYWQGNKDAQAAAAHAFVAAEQLEERFNTMLSGIDMTVGNGEIWIPEYEMRVRYPIRLGSVFGLEGSWFGAQHSQPNGRIKVAPLPFNKRLMEFTPYDRNYPALAVDAGAEVQPGGRREAFAAIMDAGFDSARIVPGEVISQHS